MKQIEAISWEKGYRNLNGNKIAHSTMSNVIQNPKYKGYYVGNKVKVIDIFTKKQKFLPPEEWVMFKDETGEIVPAIVSEELWDRANDVLRRRSEDVKNRQGICNHANLLTGKLFCTSCGMPYYRRESKRKNGPNSSKWVFSGKINNGSESCGSFAVYEDEIKPLLFEVFKETAADAQALIEEYILMYKMLDGDGDIQKQISEQERRIGIAGKKRAKLLEYNVTGQISDKNFIEMTKQCDKETEVAERKLMELEEQQNSKAEFKKHIETIRRVLQAAERDAAKGIINKEFVDRYIDKIFVTPVEGVGTSGTSEDIGNLRLEIKIFTGETTEKHLSKLKSRTGHTFKNVYPERRKKYFRREGMRGIAHTEVNYIYGVSFA